METKMWYNSQQSQLFFIPSFKIIMKTRVLNNKKQSEFSQEITRISVLKFTKKYHTKNIQIN